MGANALVDCIAGMSVDHLDSVITGSENWAAEALEEKDEWACQSLSLAMIG